MSQIKISARPTAMPARMFVQYDYAEQRGDAGLM